MSENLSTLEPDVFEMGNTFYDVAKNHILQIMSIFVDASIFDDAPILVTPQFSVRHSFGVRLVIQSWKIIAHNNHPASGLVVTSPMWI